METHVSVLEAGCGLLERVEVRQDEISSDARFTKMYLRTLG